MYILGLRTVICNHQTYIPNLRTAIVAIADFGAMTVWMGMLSSFTTMCANGLQEVIAVLILAKKNNRNSMAYQFIRYLRVNNEN